jgi:altronate dehydratase small subunit
MKNRIKLQDKAIIIDPADNVATARAEIDAGTVLLYDGKIVVREKIPFGFKLALRQIAREGAVIKYGQRIGVATCDIAAGELVHVHNVSGERGKSR